MENHAINPDIVLRNHGGVADKNFAKIINEEIDADEVDLICHSPYYTSSHLPPNIAHKGNSFGVLSLNSQNILAKFSGLQVMLELFASQNIHFPVICIQETWLQDDSKIPFVSLEGYKCFHVKALASAHGGLITYVDDEFNVSVKRIITNSNIWEGQFLELNHEAFQNKIVIGNEYKPPRDNNNAGNLNAFKLNSSPSCKS